jgi:hypothetical protein
MKVAYKMKPRGVCFFRLWIAGPKKQLYILEGQDQAILRGVEEIIPRCDAEDLE